MPPFTVIITHQFFRDGHVADRGIKPDVENLLTKLNIYDFDLVKMADNIIFLRFLTQRLAEKYGYQIVFDTRYFGNTRVDNNLITTISSDLMRGDDGIKCLNSNLSILKNTKNTSD
jgi:hypothetical protein